MRCLGPWLNSNLNFKHHVSIKCKSVIWNLQKIQNIHHLFDRKTCELLVCSLVLTHLDYSNRILFSCADNVIQKLQCVQNFAAKVVLQKGRIYSSKLALGELHWLPIKTRIEFKIIM